MIYNYSHYLKNEITYDQLNFSYTDSMSSDVVIQTNFNCIKSDKELTLTFDYLSSKTFDRLEGAKFDIIIRAFIQAYINNLLNGKCKNNYKDLAKMNKVARRIYSELLGLLIKKIEFPITISKINDITYKVIDPVKTYEQQIKLYMYYDLDIKH